MLSGALTQELLSQHPEAGDLTHVNMLAELFIKMGQPQQVLDLVQEAATQLCGDEGLPIELQVRLAHIGKCQPSASAAALPVNAGVRWVCDGLHGVSTTSAWRCLVPCIYTILPLIVGLWNHK